MGIYNLGGGGGAPVLEARTVTPSTSQQIIKPSRDEYDGLSQVTVEATPLETRTANPSTSSQTITPIGSNIGFSTITVNPYRLQSKSVTPSNVPYTVSSDSGYNGLSSVTFGKDTNLVAGNIVKGKTIYGVTGTNGGIKAFYYSGKAYPTSSTKLIVTLTNNLSAFSKPGNTNYIHLVSCSSSSKNNNYLLNIGSEVSFDDSYIPGLYCMRNTAYNNTIFNYSGGYLSGGVAQPWLVEGSVDFSAYNESENTFIVTITLTDVTGTRGIKYFDTNSNYSVTCMGEIRDDL